MQLQIQVRASVVRLHPGTSCPLPAPGSHESRSQQLRRPGPCGVCGLWRAWCLLSVGVCAVSETESLRDCTLRLRTFAICTYYLVDSTHTPKDHRKDAIYFSNTYRADQSPIIIPIFRELRVRLNHGDMPHARLHESTVYITYLSVRGTCVNHRSSL